MDAYELTLKERLLILSVLPKEGNVVNLRIKQNLIGKVGVSDEEHKEFEIREEGPSLRWGPQGNIPKKFELKEKEVDLIVNGLKGLDTQGRLTSDHLEIYEKFVEKKGGKNADT